MWTGEKITNITWISSDKICTQEAPEDPQLSQVPIVPLCITIIPDTRKLTTDGLRLAMRRAMMTAVHCPRHTTEEKAEMDTEKAQRLPITG